MNQKTARTRCEILLQDLARMERSSAHSMEWHRTHDDLKRALAAYRAAGATNADMIRLGLSRQVP